MALLRPVVGWRPGIIRASADSKLSKQLRLSFGKRELLPVLVSR